MHFLTNFGMGYTFQFIHAYNAIFEEKLYGSLYDTTRMVITFA